MGILAKSTIYDSYSPVGDIVVIAMCFVMLVLAYTSFVSKNKTFLKYNIIVALLFVASLADITFNYKLSEVNSAKGHTIVYVLHFLYHFTLYTSLYMYVLYIIDVQRLEISKKRPIIIVSTSLLAAISVLEVLGITRETGFHIDENGAASRGKDIFPIGYIAFVAIIVFLMVVFRNRLFRQVMRGFYGTMLISFIIIAIQYKSNQGSFTVATFLFPAVAMLYIVHSNPYNIEGLTPETDYEVQVQGIFEEKGTTNWTESVFFTTLAAPVPEKAYYLIGTFNGWDPENMIPFEEEDGVFTLTYEFGGEFKIKDEAGNWWGGGVTLTEENPSVTLIDGGNLNLNQAAEYTLTIEDGVLTVTGFPAPQVVEYNGGWKWFGGQADGDFFLITNELLGGNIALVDGSNFKVQEGGSYDITVKAYPEDKGISEPLAMVITKTLTGISTIGVDGYDNNAWYNLNGQKLNGKPTTPGIYINGHKKVVIK